MSKPFHLKALLDLARFNSDAAAARLGILNGRDQDMAEQLRLLLEYRSEYSANLERMVRAGMRSTDWRNFRKFIDKIDAAIAQHRDSLNRTRQEVHAGRQHWHLQQQKLKSFDTLSDRHRSAELQGELKREQRDQDDMTLKNFLGGRAPMS